MYPASSISAPNSRLPAPRRALAGPPVQSRLLAQACIGRHRAVYIGNEHAMVSGGLVLVQLNRQR